MAAEVPVLKRVDIVPARPEDADSRSFEAIERREGVSLSRSVWMVVLSLDQLPEPKGRTLFLYLGDYWVRKYWAFEGGIYFKVYNPRFFAEHGGKPFTFVAEDGTVTRTGESLPELPPEGERSADPRFVTSAEDLPSQRAVLAGIARR